MIDFPGRRVRIAMRIAFALVPILLVVNALPRAAEIASAQTSYTQHWHKCDVGYRSADGSPRFAGFSPYFVNERIGFAFGIVTDARTGSKRPMIYRTLSGGDTWQPCNMTGFVGAVNSLFFVTAAHGYAASGQGDDELPPGGGIFETFDTGYTWRSISPNDSAHYNCARVISGRVSTSPLVVTMGDIPWRMTGTVGVTPDDGRTWQSPAVGNENGYSDSMSRFAVTNLAGDNENFLTSVGLLGNRYYTVATTNGGTSWTRFAGIGGLLSSTYCLPHHRTLFGTNSGGIVRNVNLATKWDTIFHASGIEGAGCAIYCSGDTGHTPVLFRSTDAGDSWDTVLSPPPVRSSSYQFQSYYSVVRNGAVLYMISPDGTMWKTTDGGDGRMTQFASAYTTSFSHQLQPGSINNTLATPICDSATLAVQFQYTGSCSFGWLDHVQIDGLDSSEYIVRQTRHWASENKPDTAWLTIVPAHPGTRQLVVHTLYTNDDREVNDTTFAVTLSVAPKLHPLSFSDGSSSVSTIDFGTQSLCKSVRMKSIVGIAAPSCAAITVDSVVLHVAPAASGDFGFTSTKGFAASDAPHMLPISFAPSIAGLESGSLVVYYFDGVQHHADSIAVQGTGVADSRNFAVTSDTIRTSTGVAARGAVLLNNTTCGLLAVDSLQLPSGLTLPLATKGESQLPIAFDAGDNRELVVSYAGSVPGMYQANILAHMRFIEHNATVVFDTVIAVTAVVSQTSSVSETGPKASYSIWIVPNPASRAQVIEFANLEDAVDVSMVDVLGKEVLHRNLSRGSGAGRIEFDLSMLPIGRYYLRIVSGSKIETRSVEVRR